MSRKIIKLTESDLMAISSKAAFRIIENAERNKRLTEGRFGNAMKKIGKGVGKAAGIAGLGALGFHTALTSNDPYLNSDMNPLDREAAELQRDILDQNEYEDSLKRNGISWDEVKYVDQDDDEYQGDEYNESVIARAVNESIKKHLKKKKRYCGGSSCC